LSYKDNGRGISKVSNRTSERDKTKVHSYELPNGPSRYEKIDSKVSSRRRPEKRKTEQ
jgi:hypothetical protein